MQCPKCHTENSESAKFCTHCGHSLTPPISHTAEPHTSSDTVVVHKNSAFEAVAIGLFVLFGIVGLIVGGVIVSAFIKENANKSPKTTTESAQGKKVQPSPYDDFAYDNSSDSDSSSVIKGMMGDKIQLSDRTIEVIDAIDDYDLGSYYKPTAGKFFMLVKVGIENSTNYDIQYSSSDFRVQDTQGDQQSDMSSSSLVNYLGYGELAPGGRKVGNMVFEVTQNEDYFYLVYKTYNGEKAVIDLPPPEDTTTKPTPSTKL